MVDHYVEFSKELGFIVGHCKSDDLVDHYTEFSKELGFTSSHLLHFGMDGPKVNLSFENKMSALLEQSNDTFLKLGSCSLHPVHTAFANGIKALFQGEVIIEDKDGNKKESTFDLDDFFQDLHFFFKLSSARREDYASLADITTITAEYTKRHAETRWVSMKYVALRVLEQWANLTEYFLKFVPRQKNFKKEIKNTQRYIRIKTALENELMVSYVAFCAFAADDFEKFLVPFQSGEPRIHLLYTGLCDLLYSILRKFVKNSKLDDKEKDKNIYIDVNKCENLKDLKNVEIGVKAKSLLKENGIYQHQCEKFRKDCLKFYYKACSYMQTNLPFDVPVIKQAQYLHPEKKMNSRSLNAISNLAYSVVSTLGEKDFRRVFEAGLEESREKIVDQIKSQWVFYQNEVIEETWYINTAETTSSRIQPSYWRRAEELCCLQGAAPVRKFKRIDEYWRRIGALTDDNGNLKYAQLFCLAKCVLSLSHGNAIPERGFSINKQILNIHGYSTYSVTLEALRLKDELHRVGGEANFKITRELLEDVKASYQRYEADRVAREALKAQDLAKQQRIAEEKSAQAALDDELGKIDVEIEKCKASLDVANGLISEAQSDLNQAVGSAEKNDLIGLVKTASGKLNVGNDRKRQCEGELRKLEAKKSKLQKQKK